MNESLRFRQIHLDYHTSELMENVGGEFDGQRFVTTLKEAHVNSVSCFARCHHGWLYYDSKRFPDAVHPNLKKRNLLLEQIKVCHENDIKVPVYISVQWDYYISQKHPEWLCQKEDGSVLPPKASDIGFYTNFCIGSPYADYIQELTDDVIDVVGEDLDGLFYDIVWDVDCYCEHCRNNMAELRLDVENIDDVKAYSRIKVNAFMKRISDHIRSRNDKLSIYYNNGSVKQGSREGLDSFSHLEFDALPSGNHRGYKRMLLRSRFDRTLGKDYVGQTGRFHTAWADFGTYKSQEALEYECFKLLSYGAKCLIGDQMLPNGRLNPYAYDLIGKVYEQVEEVEPWCGDIEPLVEIGLFTPDEFGAGETVGIAAAAILEEAGYQFDILDSFSDFNRYKLIILADHVTLDEVLKGRLEAYLCNGGKLIGTFESGLNPQKDQFALDAFSVKRLNNQVMNDEGQLACGTYDWRNRYADYMKVDSWLCEGLYETPYMMYTKALAVEPVEDGFAVGSIYEPEFYRTQDHFCAHRQAPHKTEASTAGVVITDQTVYFAHPMFGISHHCSPVWVKTMLKNSIEHLMSDRIVSHGGPSTLQLTVNGQKKEGRYVLHMLHYIPQRKSQEIEIIDTKIPLYNTEVTMRLPEKVTSVKCVRTGDALPYTENGGLLTFTVPYVNGYELVELSYQ